MLSAMLMFALALQSASAQDPAAERAVDEHGGWKTVLAPGTLGRNAEIVPVEGGFAFSSRSFEDSTWFFDSDWALYDPYADAWSPMTGSPYSSFMVSIHDESLAHHRLEERLPKESTEVQIVDDGTHAVFIQHEYWHPGLYNWGMSIIDLSTYEITELTYWGGSAQPQKLVRDFPDENLLVAGDLLIWLDGGEVQKHWLDDYILTSEFRDFYLASFSPDMRFWLIGAETVPRPGYVTNAGLLYDRATGEYDVLFVGDWGIPSDQRSVWLDSSAVLINRRSYLLHVDAETGEQKRLLEEELASLTEINPFIWQYLSNDGQRFMVRHYHDGDLLLHKTFA